MDCEIVHEGTELFDKGDSLSSIFFAETDNQMIAWYIDYFTEDIDQFQVRYLAETGDTCVMMTNEDKEKRDFSDPDKTVWGAEDVAEWFKTGGGDTAHRWLFIFGDAAGMRWGLHVEAYRVFAFGPEELPLPTRNLWDSYVVDGIAGPCKLVNTIAGQGLHLDSIIIDAHVYARLRRVALVQHWLTALAGIVDA